MRGKDIPKQGVCAKQGMSKNMGFWGSESTLAKLSNKRLKGRVRNIYRKYSRWYIPMNLPVQGRFLVLHTEVFEHDLTGKRKPL